MIKNRAITNEQKREICDRLYAVWSKHENAPLRLGQFIWERLIAPLKDDQDLFFMKDYDLIKELEKGDQ